MTHDPLDRHLDALGGELDRGVARADRTRRRRIVSAAAGSALVAVALGAFVALPGGREFDPVAEARAAVTEGNGVLHFVATQEFLPPASSRRARHPDPAAMEVWTTTGGEGRYRVLQPADGRPRYCGMMMFGGPARTTKSRRRIGDTGPLLTSPTEYVQNGREQIVYSAFSRAAVATRLPKDVAASEYSQASGLTPSFGAVQSGDPTVAIRAALQSGELRDAGPATVDGRKVRKLVGRAGPSRAEAKRLEASDYPVRARWRKAQLASGRPVVPTRYTYLVDAETAAPVELRTDRYAVWSRAGGRDHWVWTGELTRFQQFERLDASPASRALLDLALPAGTTMYRASADGDYVPSTNFKRAMAREKKAVRRCEAAKR